jgi:Protein of unknown function (DUF1501)
VIDPAIRSTIPLSRRTFVVASGLGFAGMTFARPAPGAPSPSQLPPGSPQRTGAKSTILFFLCGGASHIDCWDMKPAAPLEYRGLFQPIETTAPGIRLCEHLPLLATQAHHLALVNSIDGTVNTNDHHAGYYYNLTGHVPDSTFLSLGNNRTPYSDDWPYMGSVIAAKRPARAGVPSAITLPHKPSKAPYTRPGQFAARLGVEFDPIYVGGQLDKPLEFHAPALVLEGDVTTKRLLRRHDLLRSIDQAQREFDAVASSGTWTQQQERALSLLLSSRATKAFDVAQEPVEVRRRYGETVNGMSLLLARRLVEAGVPFVTVFWMEDERLADRCRSAGGWDTHGNNFHCLKEYLLPEFDRGYSALLEDLAARRLLDQTLVLVTSEMGRKPRIGDPRSGGIAGAGRDHWTHCLTDLLAGGGIRGGQTFGASDRYAEHPADRPVTPADVTKTVYHAMGIDNLEAVDRTNRPYNLLAEGRPLTELF